MTPKQILDSFSETLMQDGRILSPQERELVSTLMQHAKAATVENRQTQEAVRAVIASAVGEIVAQRAFSALGESIVQRILQDSSSTLETTERREFLGNPTPSPPAPSPDPQHPGVKAPRKEPQQPMRGEPTPPPPAPAPDPQHPGVRAPRREPLRDPVSPPTPAPDPQHPGVRATSAISHASVAVADRPETLPAKCVVLDEFLAPQELADLMRFTLNHESDFQTSELISPNSERGVVNYDYRRSRVLMDLDQQEEVMVGRIKSVLPQVLDKLGMAELPVASVEAQITASNDGDFFHCHSDNGSGGVATRYLTFVYFFHREPRQFEGGELRLHDARLDRGVYVSQGSYQTIVPQQNQVVFFPCELLHEITPVKCPSGAFADSRFTMNGWLRR